MFDYKGFLKDWKAGITQEKREKAEYFLSPDASMKRYVYGNSPDIEKLCRIIKIDGIINDFIPAGTLWNGIPSIHVEEVPFGSYVVNGTVCTYPSTVTQKAKEAGITNLIQFCDLYRTSDCIEPFDFVIAIRNDFQANYHKWEKLSKSFNDAESVQTFQDIIKFRLTGDHCFMNNYRVALKEQYFADFVTYGKNEVFIDAGGFDGYTTENFCNRCPNYTKVYLFEPVGTNMDIARKKLAGHPNIEFILKGVSDNNTKLCFDSSSKDASAVVESGSEKIDVVKLDDAISDKITFIKMDLEGHELQALEGAKGHIRTESPKLAISVYHRCSDFYQIHEKIMKFCPDYKVYLRHYTEGWAETVMYFIR